MQPPDYAYSHAGDLPKYLPTLAFPPSYFHRIIRTMGSGNPICHIDIAPWGEETVSNPQLIPDRMRSETYVSGYCIFRATPLASTMRAVRRATFTPSCAGTTALHSLRGPVVECGSAFLGALVGGCLDCQSRLYESIVIEAEALTKALHRTPGSLGECVPTPRGRRDATSRQPSTSLRLRLPQTAGANMRHSCGAHSDRSCMQPDASTPPSGPRRPQLAHDA